MIENRLNLALQVLAPFVSEERKRRIDAVATSRLSRLIVVLEDAYDPHNAAAVLRTCEALGMGEAHVIERAWAFRCSDRVTQGAHRWMDVVRHSDAKSALTTLKARNFCVFGAALEGTLSCDDLPIEEPLALLFGNEHGGLSSDARGAVDGLFRLPMWGFTMSFNLSVAVALAASEVAKRMRAQLGASGDLQEEAVAKLRYRWYRQSVRGADGILRRAGLEDR